MIRRSFMLMASVLVLLFAADGRSGPEPPGDMRQFVIATGASEATGLAPGNTKFGAYFFYWHDEPNNNWRPAEFRYHPAGSYAKYSSLDKSWYVAEIADMSRAGLDYIFPICWGNHPWDYLKIAVLGGLRDAIIENGSGLKIGTS